MADRIDPAKYGTASEVSKAVGKPRTTLISAAERGELTSVHTHGGTRLIEVAETKRWAKQIRKPGPKSKANSR